MARATECGRAYAFRLPPRETEGTTCPDCIVALSDRMTTYEGLARAHGLLDTLPEES